MKFSTILLLCPLGSGTAYPKSHSYSISEWYPPRPDDSRSPCPMLNALANHELLPRDGNNLTEEAVVGALKIAINFDESFGKTLFEQAQLTNPAPNATWFTLNHLNRHNVMEHDASMSRRDAYFGNNQDFDQAIFDVTKAYWTDEVVDVKMLANGKLARQIESRSTNPNYTFTSAINSFSLTEVAFLIVVFGDFNSVTVRKDFLEYFFENERLPSELGWLKKDSAVTFDQRGLIVKTQDRAFWGWGCGKYDGTATKYFFGWFKLTPIAQKSITILGAGRLGIGISDSGAKAYYKK